MQKGAEKSTYRYSFFTSTALIMYNLFKGVEEAERALADVDIKEGKENKDGKQEAAENNEPEKLFGIEVISTKKFTTPNNKVVCLVVARGSVLDFTVLKDTHQERAYSL